jgi:hypothetical protein
MGRGKRLDRLIEITLDALSNVVYVGGVAVVELLIRPLFSRAGKQIPILANLILTVGELTWLAYFTREFLSALLPLVRGFDKLLDLIVKSKTFGYIAKGMERWREYRQRRQPGPAQDRGCGSRRREE